MNKNTAFILSRHLVWAYMITKQHYSVFVGILSGVVFILQIRSSFMIKTVCGFNQENAIKFSQEVTINQRTYTQKLDCTDIVILRWFADKYNELSKVKINENEYAIFSYTQISNDLPILNINKTSISHHIQKLNDFNLIDYKFERGYGVLCMYCFGHNYTQLLCK